MLRPRDDAEHVPQQQAAADHHQRDRADRLGHASQRRCRRSGAAQQRNQRQQRNRRQVLEQQDRERQPPVVAGQFLAFGQQLQADRGRGQRQAQADDQRGSRQSVASTTRAQRQRACSSTCRPPAPNTGLRITHRREGESSRPMTNSSITTPISAGAEHALGVVDHAEAVRPQQHAGHQVAQHRAQPELLEQRHRDHRGQQEHQGQFETTAVHAPPHEEG